MTVDASAKAGPNTMTTMIVVKTMDDSGGRQEDPGEVKTR